MKKIEHYNKKMRKTKDRSFPLTTPAANLIYRGILKVTYDRGYAIQTKSMLVGSDSTAEDLIEQLIDSLGLTGSAEDYILEERNYMTQTTRTIRKSESPLDLQLQYGPHSSMLEIGLVQIRDNRILFSGDDTESDDDAVGLKRGHVNHVPKDEVIDHGAANVGSIMDEALHDIPINVSDIKEKIRLLSESIASEGKPRNDLPSRHSLWNILKPQVSNLMKDIRHLVDTAEFLTGKHCPSEEFRLIVTLLLELITDHSRELIAVTKELCGLKGVAKTDFNASVSNFVQQLTYISKLIGVISTSLHAAALSGHLLHATAPGNFLKAPLDEESSFTGSGGVSGALIFITTTAFLGLLRAAYEDKTDYYATFTSNMLQCARKTLETVHKTNNYVSIHLHPLRNRIADMERKLKLAMDSLVKKVKIAASSHPPPVSVPEMLLAGHSLIVASLDFLLVAQCASLLHKVVIGGHELIELPWVKGWITRSDNVTNEGKNSLGEKVSNASDSTTEKSFGTISTTSSSKHYREKKLRKAASHKKAEEETSNIALGQLTLQPSHLPMNYSDESGDDADDEGGRSSVDFNTPKDKPSQRLDSPTESTSDVDSPIKQLSSQMFSNDNTKYIGIEGVQRLKQHQMLNKAIARDAEGLLLAVTQNVQFLSQQCHGDSKELYSNTIETLMEAARHLREEVSVMENELVNITNIQETLIATSERFHSLTRNIYMSLSSALSPQACDKDQMRLLTSAKSISDLCSETVQQSLSIVAEHNKAIEHAEKMENEFVTLMTGHNKTTDDRKDSDSVNHSNGKRKTLTGPKLPSDQEAESVIFEDLSTKKVTTAGRAWLAPRPTPKVSGGTLSQLTQRLTYHRVLDSEFATSFILSYHRYMSCDHLIKSLVEKLTHNIIEELIQLLILLGITLIFRKIPTILKVK
jgi:2C-methyl-D-erythritol 2,4-cyclodiphosphate synthase